MIFNWKRSCALTNSLTSGDGYECSNWSLYGVFTVLLWSAFVLHVHAYMRVPAG